MDKKYIMLKHDQIEWDGRRLSRIVAVKPFNDVDVGDLGGYIESYENLSQEGDCWVYNDAEVFGNARVSEDARICDYAKVFGEAKVSGYAKICGYTTVYEEAHIYGDAEVADCAHVHGHATLYNEAFIYDNAEVFGNARIHDRAHVCGSAKVSGDAEVSWVAKVDNEAELGGDAFVRFNTDFVYYILGSTSRPIHFTFFNCKDKKVKGIGNSFFGTIPEFREKVEKKLGNTRNNKKAKECLALADLVELHFSEE